MQVIEQLAVLRNHGGAAWTAGLDDATIERFCSLDSRLGEAAKAAVDSFEILLQTQPDLLQMDERDLIRHLQADLVNFYASDAVCPFVPLAARGPWIVTIKGAVVHDNGGYGMLGFGHTPEAVLEAMAKKQVMANVMTPSFSQRRLTDALKAEIGHKRGNCPFPRFLFMNSGSESVSVAARIADINAKTMTDPGAPYANWEIRKVALTRGFHGRTDRPARFSDSTRKKYGKHLATFRDRDNLITVAPNDIEQLRQVFQWATQNRTFIEAMFMEPVMGEGNPGQAASPEFYAEARRLTREHGTLLLIDSIQAGIRAHGVLSICDYPGFEDLDPPDMETYSKALNAGQYPMSVLAMTEETANIYRKGVYGNTMTSNPRALDVAHTVLASLTPEVRKNIVRRGQEFVERFESLKSELDGAITAVQGTGLLFSIELDADRYLGFGEGSTEEFLRVNGVNVIHGGANSLRYTPHFNIGSEEVDLIVEATRTALLRGPVKKAKSQDPSASASVAA